MNGNAKDAKPIPTYLRSVYPYPAAGTAITDSNLLEASAVYEISCSECDMRVRARGQKIRSTFERLRHTGCLNCGSRELAIRSVDMGNTVIGNP